MTKTYSQEDMDKMKMELDINHQLMTLTKTCEDISHTMLKHIAIEANDSSKIMDAVEQASIDRRKCETDIRRTMNENTATYFNTFVKKADLKLYATLIMMTVIGAASIQAWVTKQGKPSIELLQSIERAVK